MTSVRIVPVLALALTTGCDDKSGGTGQPERAPNRPPAVRTVTAKPQTSAPVRPPRRDAPAQTFGGGEMSVELETAGDEPRRELRYAIGPVDRHDQLHVELEPPGGLTMKIGLTLAWKNTSSKVVFDVDDAKLESASGKAAGPQQAMFDRMRASFTMVGGEASVVDGRQIALTQNRGQTTTPPVPWMVHALTVPLPAEAVGVGAKWTVRQTIDTLGRKGRTERRYELRGLEGDRLDVSIAGTDRWKAAGGRAEGTTTLSGTTTTSLTDPLPQSAKVSLIENVEAKGKTPRGETTVTVRLGGG
jgi:hypothetical protein